MWNNYLKVALRNLTKQKLYSFINVLGLAIGLAFSCLVALFVRHELSFDQFHENKDGLYRTYQTYYFPDGSAEEIYDDQPAPLGEALQAGFPEVERYVRLLNASGVIRQGVQAFDEDLLFVDTSFFEMFSFQLLAGDRASVLKGQNDAVLSELMAIKYFGDDDPLGQSLSIRVHEEFVEYTVVGVVAGPPVNSSIRFDILLPIEGSPIYEQTVGNWGWHSFPTFIQLANGANAEGLAEKLTSFWSSNNQEELEDLQQEGWPQGQPYAEYKLQAMVDMHLDTSIESEVVSVRNPSNLYLLTGIALAILLIALYQFYDTRTRAIYAAAAGKLVCER